ncbi:MAG: CHRD domain-containing protein, partial [Candidatus Marinimicrobia bacterium]|nr:CHRD domain-containing protein [Candidatus Neomarinimicrobiota bacterium]
PITSIGSGLAVLSLNSDRTQLEYDITISQITPTAAHFHNAGAGISAGVVKTLDFVDGHASGIWAATDGTQPLTAALVEELLSGRLYVNVHTSANPGGEIRGQVRTFSGYNAQLSGSQSVPAVSSSGSGTFTSMFFYDDSGAELEYDITVEGLTIAAAHFHAGAADETGGVIKTITFDGNSASGVWTSNDAQALTDSIVDLIRSGGVYVNIHTSANPGGEIRGQLLPGIIEVPVGVIDKVREVRTTAAILTGANSVPPVTSSATGTLTGALTNDWTEFHYAITIEGLTPTAAHFHNGAFNGTGGVVKALDFSGGMTISGVWSATDGTQPFTTELLDELLAGRIYVNIHTSANPGGEIRGNILTFVPFKASLSGAKSVPPVTSSGVGTGVALLAGSERVLSYGLNVTGLTPTASHFHGGSATMTGGVVKTITLANDSAVAEWLGDDTQPLTDILISDLLLGNVYMNVHTSANPGGEIRSQLEREDATTFLAFINGGNHSPPITSIGSGLAFITLNSDQTQLEYDITISQITPTVAHFHNAGAGISAGVVKTLDFVDGHARGIWSATDGSQPLTSLLVEELLSGRLYVNVHTTANPGGEIRGQVRTFSGFNAQLSGSQTVPAVASLASGTLTSTLFYTDSGAVLEYDITVEGLTMTASHFHAGAAGETGGVIKTITFDGNSATGIWTANDAQPLTDDIVDMIRSGGVYVNIHTSANPGGEIRGQLLPEIIEVPV